METKQSKAIVAFQGGLNCSQAVFSAYCEQLNIEKSTALSITCGFGAGMGRLQETCGTVTGAFMALSMHACKKYTDNGERKEKSYALIQEFNKRFVAIHGSAICRDILNCNLLTDEGRKYAADNNVFRTVCDRCVIDAITIADELMAN